MISLGANTTGTLIINYDFFTIPDDLRVYYEGQRIFDSGVVSGSGTYSVDFGPGSATNVVIIMNQDGNGQTNSDLWTYDATVITREITYATFTEDTNKTTTPIKFAPPPFGAGSASNLAVTAMASSFEGVAATSYTSTTPPGGVDGWTVLDTNPVTVVTVTALADTGTNVLALHNGSISRLLPTVPGGPTPSPSSTTAAPCSNPSAGGRGTTIMTTPRGTTIPAFRTTAFLPTRFICRPSWGTGST